MSTHHCSINFTLASLVLIAIGTGLHVIIKTDTRHRTGRCKSTVLMNLG
jgi:hypothetical protein